MGTGSRARDRRSLGPRALDVEAVRAALGAELGMQIAIAGEAHEVPRIRVRLLGARQASIELLRPDGSRLRRRAELPSHPEERLETIVIVATNMVRDEAAELLALLGTRRPAPEAIRPEANESTGPTTATTGSTATEPPADPSTDTATEAGATDPVGAPVPGADTGTEAIAGASESAPSSVLAAARSEETSGVTPIASAAPETAATQDDAGDPSVAASAPEQPELDAPSAPGQRLLRIALSGLTGSVPRGRGYEATLIAGLEVAITPTDFLAFGLRDLGGGAPLNTSGRWSAGGAAFAEGGWILIPELVLHLQLGVDVRGNGLPLDRISVGVAPFLIAGARLFAIRELSFALQTALHVIATDSWSSNLHVLPQGAVLWTVGLNVAVHIS